VLLVALRIISWVHLWVSIFHGFFPDVHLSKLSDLEVIATIAIHEPVDAETLNPESQQLNTKHR
jgi:hypothetical protein